LAKEGDAIPTGKAIRTPPSIPALIAALAATAALTVGLGAPPSAQAISRQRANRVALRVLGTAKLRRPVVLFGLPRSLAKGTRVMEAGPGPTTRKKTKFKRTRFGLKAITRVANARLPRRAWLFWEDLLPYGEFQHPSILLLIDDRTGRVLRRQAESLFPLVNGRLAAFLRSPRAYGSGGFRVFANFPPAGAGRAAATTASRTRAPPLAAAALAAPPNLTGSCVITIGDRVDPLFGGSFKLIAQVARELHLSHYDAKDGIALDAEVNYQIRHGCRDVLIVIAGHGFPAVGSNYKDPNTGQAVPESGFAQVGLQYSAGKDSQGKDIVRSDYLDSEAVRKIMKKHRHVGFKLVVDSCFSGRWMQLFDVPNLRFIATGSRSDQFGFGAVPATYDDGQHFMFPTGSQKAGVITYNPAVMLEDHTTNPNLAQPFINGILRGLDFWAHSDADRATTGDDLAKALVVAFAHEGENNFIAQKGTATPQVLDESGRMPEGGPVVETEDFGSDLAEDPFAALGDFFADVAYIPNTVAAKPRLRGAQARGYIASATAPADGTVTQITVKGNAVSGDMPGPGGSEPIRFSVARPQPDGRLVVITTTNPPFTLPGTPGTYTYDMSKTSFPCCKLKKGDVVTLDARGGRFAVFGRVPGSVTDTFSMAGPTFDAGTTWTPTHHPDVELLMRVTERPG